MSVLVKGMEMPKSCGRCWFNNSSLSCAITGSCIDRDDENGDRLDDCPIVALPDKHGRLVEFIDVVTTLDEDSGTEEVCLGDIMRAYYEMRNAPTIVEAEDSE